MSRMAATLTGMPRNLSSSISGIWPGLMLAAMIAAAASFVASTYGGPVMLLALLMGLALNFTSEQQRAAAGIGFASKKVLRFGIALLGLRITFSDVATLGLQTVELVAVGVLVTIGAGVAAAWLLGRSKTFGLLVGGATAICGASAALAISSVLPRQSEAGSNEAAFTIVAVTALSTVAMVVYPALFSALGFSDHEIGILLGATIHDVAQVVGAGYAVSQEAGDTATVVKLFRVALLFPTVIVISLIFATKNSSAGDKRSGLVPFFAVAFAILVIVNSTGLVPPWATAMASNASQACLVVAVAAIGLSTSLRKVASIGAAPSIIAGVATLILLVYCVVAAFLLF